MTTEEILNNSSLRYSSDRNPGITRKIVGKKFRYFDTKGKIITDKEDIDRINKLVIPPAYKNVWICPYKNGYLQAVGYDARGRKQYRYHPLWTKLSQEGKFAHLVDFAKHLPKIRRRIKKDLSLTGMPRQKVIAAVVFLLENTLIRIGNEEYEKDNKSYGLTTLKNRHVDVTGTDKIVLQFKGKSGVYHKVKFYDKKIASILRRCKELPGQDLFEYVDDEGKVQNISSHDVNNYLKEITGAEITAKDFRTWGGTVLAASALDAAGINEDDKVSKKTLVDTVKKVAEHLRNKPSTCRKYYIHPSIMDAYTEGHVISNLKSFMDEEPANITGLDKCENKVLAMLQHMVKAN